MVIDKEIPDGYKSTECGVIPQEWDGSQTIGMLFDFKNGLNKAKEYFGYGTPIVNYMDVYSKKGLVAKDIKGRVKVSPDEIKAYGVRKGDVFFTRTSETPDEIGVTTTILEELENAVFSGFILRARPKTEQLDISYQKFCFSSSYIRNKIVSSCTYTTRALTNGTSLSKIFIPIPPKSEQQAIATALSDVEDLISSLEKLIEKKSQIRQGTMQQLLTGNERLEGFSDEWGSDVVKNLASITTGSRNTQDRQANGEFPFFVRSSVVERINSYSYDGEAVLTAGDGVGTGKIFHYINGKFDFHQRVYKISDFTDRIHGYFFYLYFATNFYNRIISMTAKSSVDSVRIEMIADMSIPLPPIEEQKAIAQILSDIDSEIEKLKYKLEKYKVIKQGMMQELLKGTRRLV